ncbi:hypothetical protein OV203_33565 [Nannocystis sp. ILAH1]|uniref:hypothetical protein n=1 Tax=Nannocystis sp. ILAH1 TaxID=2996789 RepID=UPI00226EC46C|nr:hypothetical protein [Nannocystis sp. ILAH1]MCY0992115.1 hypothetical protein [Nannocystis sp. ILAH1]
MHVVLDSPLVVRPLAAADAMRRRWLHLLGPAARPIVRRRELRVALVFSALILLALAGALLLPLWLLLLAPIAWGVPHLIADLRYLVIRSGYHLRTRLWWLAGGPLLWVAVGGELVWGFVAAMVAAILARAELGRRLVAVVLLAAAAAAVFALGGAGDLVFSYLHNFLAIAFWWLWRPRAGRLHLLPLALLLAAAAFLLSPAALALSQALGGLAWSPASAGPDHQLWRLAPGLPPELGLRLVLLFCFSQSLHYGVWLHLVPDEDRERATPPTFRASYDFLRRDLGDVGLVVAALLTLAIAAWAVVDLAAANLGYFRMARFHGHLELVAGTLLLLERRR